ncbi:MFS transporter [Kitasatospora sp. NPDC002227]|uniref:MFS transporter n=1 Tax=Kitasatospora sp. NPDC002227 TaxID=3154773 RepID=UPI0033333D18
MRHSLGLVLLAAVLRAPVTCLAPVLGLVRDAYGLGGVAVSLLTTLPVLCLGLFAPLAPALARRAGTEATVAGALAVLTAGSLLRALPSTAALFGGTVLVGAGIAVANVLLPAHVKQHLRVGRHTGLAMTVMSGTAALAAALAVPLAEAAGWRAAVAVWALPALAAATAWTALARRAGGRAVAPAPPRPARPEVVLLRSPLALALTGFLGAVSLMFYVLTAWLPELMQAQGYTAAQSGLMVSVLLTIGIPLGFATPVVAARRAGQGPVVAVVAAAMGLGLAGLLLVPGAGWLWVVLLGLGNGCAFPLAVTLLTLRAADPHTAARLSGIAQTGGYLLAALGPLAVGLLHAATGGWTAALLLLLALVLPETAAGLLAARPDIKAARVAHPNDL